MALATGCVLDVEGFESSDVDEYRFVVTGIPDIDLSTFDGPIDVEGWDRQAVEVVVEKRAANGELLDEIEVETEQDGDRIRLAVRRNDHHGVRVTLAVTSWRGAKLVARVPYQSDLRLSTEDGALSLARVTGMIDLRTEDGSIRGGALGGTVSAATDDGAIRFDDVDGAVHARTEDGRLDISGRLFAVDVATDDGSIHVVAGPGSAMRDDWRIETEDGRVHVELPSHFDGALDVATDDGRVRLADRFGGRGADSTRAVRRTLGDGGFVLRVRSDDGSIRIDATPESATLEAVR